METPPITITRLDFERLEKYLDSDAVSKLPGSSMLYEELMRANVVETEDIGPDIVTMNSTVGFMDEQSKTSHQLTLVYPDQAGTPGTVSIFAPVGSALLGLSVGQCITWRIPGGRQLQLTVVSVSGQPEAKN
jgi:regulator of nucleoside diphosphate kinase